MARRASTELPTQACRRGVGSSMYVASGFSRTFSGPPKGGHYVRSEQLVLVGVRGGGRARRQIEFREDVADVAGDGLLADAQSSRDRPVLGAGGDEAQHFDLAAGQSRSNVRRGLRRQRGDPRRGRRRTKLLEGLLGRLELELCAFVVSEQTIGQADQHAALRKLVRRIQLLPRRASGAEVFERRGRLSLGE